MPYIVGVGVNMINKLKSDALNLLNLKYNGGVGGTSFNCKKSNAFFG